MRRGGEGGQTQTCAARRPLFVASFAAITLVACNAPSRAQSDLAVSATASAAVVASAPASSPGEAPATNAPLVRFTHVRPVVGTPAALAFSMSSGLGGWSSDASTRSLLIDGNGGVWRSTQLHTEKRSEQVGRVSVVELERIRGVLRAAAAPAAVADGPGCLDCGSTAFFAYLAPRAEPLLLASGGAAPRRAGSAAARDVVAWITAINARALRLPRERPLGLDLPIVGGLTDTPVEPAAPAGFVFAIEQRATGMATGVRVDAHGDVLRFVERSGNAAAVRKVGKLSADEVALWTRRARKALTLERVEQSGARLCTILSFRPSASEDPVVLSKHCSSGTRLVGADADAVLAWLYALDEQAAPVGLPGWPK